MTNLLSISRLCVRYGGATAVRDVTFDVAQGEAVGLAGANAAGKSSVLKALVGVVRPHSGSIHFDGARIEGRTVHTAARRGLVLVPAGRNLFGDLTVRENLRLGAIATGNPDADLSPAIDVFPHLSALLQRQAGLLSGGEQQMVAIGRGLMARPRLLLIDELSLGLSPATISELYRSLRELKERSELTLLVVDHNLTALATLVSRVLVLQKGHIALQAPSGDLLKSDAAIAAYLGKDPDMAVNPAELDQPRPTQ